MFGGFCVDTRFFWGGTFYRKNVNVYGGDTVPICGAENIAPVQCLCVLSLHVWNVFLIHTEMTKNKIENMNLFFGKLKTKEYIYTSMFQVDLTRAALNNWINFPSFLFSLTKFKTRFLPHAFCECAAFCHACFFDSC